MTLITFPVGEKLRKKNLFNLGSKLTFTFNQGTPTEEERLCTVDLLIKVACSVMEQIMFAVSKTADLN
jgi:hypothetical protein